MTERHIKVELVRVDDDAYGPAVGWWEVRVDGETVHATDDGSEASGDTARAFLAGIECGAALAGATVGRNTPDDPALALDAIDPAPRLHEGPGAEVGP